MIQMSIQDYDEIVAWTCHGVVGISGEIKRDGERGQRATLFPNVAQAQQIISTLTDWLATQPELAEEPVESAQAVPA